MKAILKIKDNEQLIRDLCEERNIDPAKILTPSSCKLTVCLDKLPTDLASRIAKAATSVEDDPSERSEAMYRADLEAGRKRGGKPAATLSPAAKRKLNLKIFEEGLC